MYYCWGLLVPRERAVVNISKALLFISRKSYISRGLLGGLRVSQVVLRVSKGTKGLSMNLTAYSSTVPILLL